MATNHLINLGHSQIAYIRGPQGNFVARRRHQGWLTALEQAGCSQGPLVEGDFSAKSGFTAASALIANHRGRFTAVVAANDQMALGAIRAFEENGIRVPGDISIETFPSWALMICPRQNFFGRRFRPSNTISRASDNWAFDAYLPS
jgi:DNA-binding LacI/PurR family transcriptional regulator